MSKQGQVILLGRPNVGKSTLLNTLLNQKVSITSPLPQTTRKTVKAVYKDDRGKILFWDTPGMAEKVEGLLGKRVNKEAGKTGSGADVVLVVVDVSRPKSEEENKVIGLMRKLKAKKLLVYNKIDKAVEGKDYKSDYQYLEDEVDGWIEVSALKGKNVKGLINLIFEQLKEGEKSLDEEDGEDFAIKMKSEDYLADLIREKAYLALRQELPYSVQVEVKNVEDKAKVLLVEADILTTDKKYKKMIIGKGGKKIKQIGQAARKEMELFAGRKIFLKLEVKVDKHWPEREFTN